MGLWYFINFFPYKVDEEGAEAATACVIEDEDECDTSGEPVSFIVDHPFFFCITSLQEGSSIRLPVLAGHCVLPTAKNRDALN